MFVKFMSLAFLVSGLGATPAQAGPREMNIAHVVGKQTALGQSVEKISEKLRKIGFTSNINHTIKEWPGVPMQGELAGMKAAEKGELQLLWVTDGPTANICPNCSIFTMPYLFANTAQATAFADNKATLQAIGKDLEKSGLHLLAIYENGWRQTFGVKENIKSPEQLKDKKFRVMQSPAYIRMVTSMGGVPNPTAWGDVYAAAKSGVLYAYEAPVNIYWAAKQYEVAPHMTETNHIYSVFFATVSKKVWDGLSADERKKIEDIIWEERTVQRAQNKKDADDLIKKMAKIPGFTDYKLTPQELAKFRDTTKVVFEDFKGKFDPEMLKAVEEAHQIK